jgi:hypothetical protein
MIWFQQEAALDLDANLGDGHCLFRLATAQASVTSDVGMTHHAETWSIECHTACGAIGVAEV